MKCTKERGKPIDNDPTRQGRGAEQGFDWRGAWAYPRGGARLLCGGSGRAGCRR